MPCFLVSPGHQQPWYWLFEIGKCYVAICDRRNLWRCRNLWLKVSQFVPGVANCDGKCRNLWQRQNMQFNDIYTLNFDKYFVLSSYLYLCETYFSRLSLSFVSSIIVFIHELFGHSNSSVMAQNSVSQWCQTFTTIISLISKAIFQCN